MLVEDTQTLQENKIQEGVIIHLFPKPRVVVVENNNDNGGGTTTDTSTNPAHHRTSGAHIPSIVIDQEEQERRSNILVLGSVEIAESQNNVKMLSLLLLVICSMRLLALLSIAMGVAEEPASSNHGGGDDDGSNSTHAPTSSNPYNSNENTEPREWRPTDYFDLVVSAIGFYVATLGMKATQENTWRLANMYLIGTVIAGIGWNAWNCYMYYAFYEEETAPSDDDDLPPLNRDDFITVAFFTVAMPLFVWGVCCARAFEFRRLIGEAEEEATERIRSQQLHMSVEDGDNNHDENENDTARNSRRSGRELMDLSATRTEI
ncbi:MAG: hypothetical protein SGARI_004879, partial [Bacillariaceae sp.]